MNLRLRTLLLPVALSALVLASACAPRQDDAAPTAPTEAERAEAPRTTAPPRQPQPRPLPPEVVYEEGWPRLFLAADAIVREDIAVEVAGLVATRDELPQLREARGESQLTPHETLLVLRHLLVSDMDADPLFEARARGQLRAALAEFVLDEIAEREAALITEEDLQAEYEARIAEFRQEPRVSVRLILVSTESEANSILDRVRGSEDFGTLASEVSLHSSRSSAGRIPPFSRGTYNSELEDLAFSLQPGELGVAPSPRGYFVVLKVADAEESVTPFEQVRESLLRDLRRQRGEEARREFLNRLESRLQAPDEEHLAGRPVQ